jgi:predicted N-acetyltransferase YhbS
VIEYRAATDSELEACVQLQHLVFRPDEPDAAERYRSYVREDPTYRPGQTRIAIVDGEIVGHLRVWDRRLAIRGDTITAGGIGSLLTHPEHRGRGIASGLLADAEKYFKEVDYDIGLLFSIIGTPFYESRGWTPIPITTFEIDVSAADCSEVATRTLNIQDDLEAVRRMHASCSSEYTGTEIRDAAYWSTGPARHRSVFPEVGIERDGELCGYINWDVVNGSPWIVECCATSNDVYEDLAAIVINASDNISSASLLGSLPRDHALVHALEELTTAQADWTTHDEMMVKISRWDLLHEKLGSDLPESFPTDQADVDDFWRTLLGAEQAGEWSDRLGPCPPTFYWWTDIF